MTTFAEIEARVHAMLCAKIGGEVLKALQQDYAQVGRAVFRFTVIHDEVTVERIAHCSECGHDIVRDPVT